MLRTWEGITTMRRRYVLGAMAGAVVVLAGGPSAAFAEVLPEGNTTDSTSTDPPLVGPPVPTETPTPIAPLAPTPAPAAIVIPPSAPVAPVATRAPATAKPDPNDPRYSPNAFPPRKDTVDGPLVAGEFALVTDDLNLRDGPDYNSKVLVVMPGGSLVSVEKRPKDNFSLVNYGSTLGWADMKYLKRLAPEISPVVGVGTLTESTPIYEQPDTTGKQVTTWKAGIPISYYAEVDGGQYKGSKRWYKVMSNPDRYISTWTVRSTATNGLQDPPPLPKTGPLGWVGALQSDANVRSGPGASHDVLKTWPAGRRVLVYGEVNGEAYNGNTQWYQVAVPPEQSLFVHSSFLKKQADVLPVDKAPYTGRWFDVNLTQQVIVAYLGTSPVYMAQTASGTKKNATDVGTYPTFWRLVSQRMQGDNLFSDDYYNLDAVPYIQYFHPSGEAIHGCYWHDNFGQPMSHGCVNTSIAAAQWLLQWGPLGTKVVVHE